MEDDELKPDETADSVFEDIEANSIDESTDDSRSIEDTSELADKPASPQNSTTDLPQNLADDVAANADLAEQGEEIPTVIVVGPETVLSPTAVDSSAWRAGSRHTLGSEPPSTKDASAELFERLVTNARETVIDAHVPPVWEQRRGFPSDSIADARNDRVVPSIMITISVAHARDLFDQCVEAGLKRASTAFHRIAKYEIDQFAFDLKCQQRAADCRLRR